MFKVEGTRTIDRDRGLELSRIGGRMYSRRSVIHSIGNVQDVKVGPFCWRIRSRELKDEERKDWPPHILKITEIVLEGPWKEWGDLKFHDLSKSESIDIIREALFAWPEIQGSDFKDKNAISVTNADLVDAWLKK